MKKLIFATGNANKMKEIRMILEDVEVVSMKEEGISLDIVENGTTFEENAIIKAKALADACGILALADDSGLEVDALNKEPGVYSARYLGEETSYAVKNKAIIDRLKGKTGAERSARFVCVIAAALPDGTVFTTRGTIEGRIGYEEKGSNGFGYDPIVYVPEYDATTAELQPEVKNEISHRGKALREMKKELQKRGLL